VIGGVDRSALGCSGCGELAARVGALLPIWSPMGRVVHSLSVTSWLHVRGSPRNREERRLRRHTGQVELTAAVMRAHRRPSATVPWFVTAGHHAVLRSSPRGVAGGGAGWAADLPRIGRSNHEAVPWRFVCSASRVGHATQPVRAAWHVDLPGRFGCSYPMGGRRAGLEQALCSARRHACIDVLVDHIARHRGARSATSRMAVAASPSTRRRHCSRTRRVSCRSVWKHGCVRVGDGWATFHAFARNGPALDRCRSNGSTR
jgi:hypothetical protein